jgi:hypothetical protein
MGHNPPVGGIYAGAKGVSPATVAEVSEGARPGPLTGQSCAMGVLGLASWGDMSVAKAKEDGGIKQVDTLDYKTMDILGVVFQKHCTIITGSATATAGDDDGAAAPAVAPTPAPAPAPAVAPGPVPEPAAPPPPPAG